MPLENFLKRAGEAAVFLDVDGTLVHLAETPDAVEVETRMLEILLALEASLGGAVALVSGRSLEDLDRLFAPHRFAAAGLHGLERRDAEGRISRHEASGGLDALRGPLRDFAAAHPGVLVEDKGAALALHYRKAPEAGAEARALVERLLAEGDGSLALVPGKMVLEVKPRGTDKGEAIRAFLGEPPFAGRRAAFLGDDVTDEDGFRVVNELGGLSIRVGDGGETAAGLRLEDVPAVEDWLAGLLAAADPETARRLEGEHPGKGRGAA